MSEILIDLKNISKSFAGVQALKNVDLTINKGEIRCLAGENGCGKSTVIKVIAGVHAPDEGTIGINGVQYKRLHPIDSIKQGIQIIYQDFSVFPNLTVAENIALNAEMSKNRHFVNWKKVRKIAQDALDMIDAKIDISSKVEDLSVADKQLVAIARSLLQNAKLIIMDEPTTALTQREVKSLFNVIKGLQQKGISILFVSHKLEEVFELAEKITIFRNGKNVISGDKSEFDRKKFIYYMTGREIAESYYEVEKTQNKTLMKVENLTRTGEFEGVSFELNAGEILAISGLLGSGRTELALALFGVKPADSGDIYIDNKPVRIKSIQDAIKNKIAYVPEDRLTEGLCLEQSIGRNVVISTVDELLNELKFIDDKKTNEQIDHWIKELSIATPSSKLPVKSLSGGNQQRVVLAKWLATRPQIFIVNGPTVGVDIGSKTDIHNILRKLAQKGVGIIIISDDLPEVLHNCNRILIMKKGKVVGEFGGRNVNENELSLALSGERK